MSKIGVPPDIVVIMVTGKCVLDKNEATWPQLWCTPSFKTGYERGLISHILSKILKIIVTFTYSCSTSSFMKFSVAQMCRLVLTTVAIINIGHSEERGKWQTSFLILLIPFLGLLALGGTGALTSGEVIIIIMQ